MLGSCFETVLDLFRNLGVDSESLRVRGEERSETMFSSDVIPASLTSWSWFPGRPRSASEFYRPCFSPFVRGDEGRILCVRGEEKVERAENKPTKMLEEFLRRIALLSFAIRGFEIALIFHVFVESLPVH